MQATPTKFHKMDTVTGPKNPIHIDVHRIETRISVEVSSVAEAVEFAESYSGKADVRVKPDRPQASSPLLDPEILALLRLLSDNKAGVDVDAICEAIGASSPKAVGRKTFAYRRRLHDLGVDFGHAVLKLRRGNRTLWSAGPALGKAIDVVVAQST